MKTKCISRVIKIAIGDRVICPYDRKIGTVQKIAEGAKDYWITRVLFDDGTEHSFRPNYLIKVMQR